MSNIFADLSEVKSMETNKTPEFQKLLILKLASELTKYHDPIRASIMDDSNEYLKEILRTELDSQDNQLTLEGDDSEKLLRLDVLDKDCNRKFYIDLSPNEIDGLEKIDNETYDTLLEYVQDPVLVMQNVSDELEKSAI